VKHWKLVRSNSLMYAVLSTKNCSFRRMLSKLAWPYGKNCFSIISTRAGRLRTCKRRAGVRGPRLEKGSESISWCGRRAQAGAPAYPRLCNRRDRRERAGAIRQQQQSQPHETPLQRRRASGRKLSTMMWPGKPSARAVGAGGGGGRVLRRGHGMAGIYGEARHHALVINARARPPRSSRACGVPRPGGLRVRTLEKREGVKRTTGHR
jgi:hypothetical protein